jgi:hypothetical protein
MYLKKKSGTQKLSPQKATIGQILFSTQNVFNGIYTQYEVKKDGCPAKVIVDIEVGEAGIEEELTVSTNIVVYPNPTSGGLQFMIADQARNNLQI